MERALTYGGTLPDLDFETYSEAGCIWDEERKLWGKPKGAQKKGISAVGAAVYAEHATTEVLCLAYNLKDGLGARVWIPGMHPPQDLFDYLATGGHLAAWNCMFEWRIWKEVCEARLGWPPLPFWQLDDDMALSRAFCMPGSLEHAGKVLDSELKKSEDGKRLIDKFCVPRKPTVKDPRTRIRPEDDLDDFANLIDYCVDDTKAESSIASKLPTLSPSENEFYLCTAAMNTRGVQLDMPTVWAAEKILNTALERYNAELSGLTGGVVGKASETAKLRGWIAGCGLILPDLTAETVTEALTDPFEVADVRRALEIRQMVGSAGVKKVYAMVRQASKTGRAHDLIIFCGARTGRDAGRDIQPQNLVKQGPEVFLCSDCGTPYGTHRESCPSCGEWRPPGVKPHPWSWEYVETAVNLIRAGSLDAVEAWFGNAVLTLSGCIRGLFVAAEGKELICSDYSSIEAVVTAVLAGEQWRIDAFQRREDIYLHGAAGVTGKTFEWYMANGGKSHPDRQKKGKPSELGLGFGGWVGAWRQFDKSDTYTDDEIKENIKAWRKASPMIVELWGGQKRGLPWKDGPRELFGLEGMAVAAIENLGVVYTYRLISFQVRNDTLYMRLPSGRELVYHQPRLSPGKWPGVLKITYMTWNSNPQMGPFGWVRMDTYGGRLAENCIQATARDILAHGVINLERAHYPVVLRVHDETVSEIPIGYGSIEEYEAILADVPEWARGWPIRAAGGWRGSRYRKD
jgi:DNA polymerase